MSRKTTEKEDTPKKLPIHTKSHSLYFLKGNKKPDLCRA
ncbi:hypothetical protein CRYPA_2018 [uncultured Candidatus Thioglobus sp.]|nr:hypothetical protein CRYPA_2018 [uncultured Candidatus Thioglobus sp.]